MELGPLIDHLLASEPNSPEAEERQHASALGAHDDADALARLSRQFSDSPEDLASLAMVYVSRRSNDGRPFRRSRR